MEFKHVKRKGGLFVLLSILTLGIYGTVVLSRVRKELSSILSKRGAKMPLSPIAAYFLGFVTLGLSWAIVDAKLASLVEMAALQKRIVKPRIGFAKMLVLGYLCIPLLFGPFVAFHDFFSLLNQVEKQENESLSLAKKKPETEKEAMKQEIALAEEKGPSEESEKPLPPRESPYPHLPHQEKLTPTPEEQSAFSSHLESQAKGKWQVRVPGEPPKRFATREEAIAYARKRAAERK